MYSLGEYYIVIPKILKVWPSYIAGKRSFVAFPIYQMSGHTLFLVVAQVYLIFYQYISRIYLNCTCCVRWGGVTPPYTPPVATSLCPTRHVEKKKVNYNILLTCHLQVTAIATGKSHKVNLGTLTTKSKQTIKN